MGPRQRRHGLRIKPHHGLLRGKQWLLLFSNCWHLLRLWVAACAPLSCLSGDKVQSWSVQACEAELGMRGEVFTTAACGKIQVTTRWLEFCCVWHGSREVFNFIGLILPDVQFCTQVCPAAAGCVLELQAF